MKVTHVDYLHRQHPPLLRMIIHGAPHRRMDIRMIQVYRVCLVMAGKRAGIFEPIDHPVDLDITFVDPTSPDLDNLLTAFYQAVDGCTLGKPSLFADDSHIHKVTMQKLSPNAVMATNKRRLPRLLAEAAA